MECPCYEKYPFILAFQKFSQSDVHYLTDINRIYKPIYGLNDICNCVI